MAKRKGKIIKEAASPITAKSVLAKVCRLCETKDGPFLNIFDADKVTAKKIEELMPFVIAENDDLSHKICFRCSAKVEELNEFIQKCIKTQVNLGTALGKNNPLVSKTKNQRFHWEKQLTKSNISNDDICDAVIKKAMEGIKNIANPVISLPEDEVIEVFEDDSDLMKPSTSDTTKKSSIVSTKKQGDTPHQVKEQENWEISSDKPSKMSNEGPSTRSSRSNKRCRLLDGLDAKRKIEKPVIDTSVIVLDDQEPEIDKNNLNHKEFEKTVNKKVEKKIADLDTDKKIEDKPFNIMDHVTQIKVNGVGVLFQCALCNRNFLKKNVVSTHGCAKHGKPKADPTKVLIAPEPLVVPEPPKVATTVKYINTKVDGNQKNKGSPNEINTELKKEENTKLKDVPEVEGKLKAKIGKASKAKRVDDSQPTPNTSQKETLKSCPSVKCPQNPSLNARYKLVTGPNNVFTLVEDAAKEKPNNDRGIKRKISVDMEFTSFATQGTSGVTTTIKDKLNNTPQLYSYKDKPKTKLTPQEVTRPYPVGLFKTTQADIHVPRITAEPDINVRSITPEPVIYITENDTDCDLNVHNIAPESAVCGRATRKKPSYTVVQTGHPSKLLIFSKRRQSTCESPKTKKTSSSGLAPKNDKPSCTVPYATQNIAKSEDPGLFTFINVDPLLEPSYVLPTDTIQESEFSNSTAPKKLENGTYSCNLCNEKFSREKKLLTHIQSHYTKMDEEDQLRAEKTVRKRERRLKSYH